MELGQRIKQARLEAGLSQRQLCGDVITRNMLSLIENGSARPSMDTLVHFARQLGKPVGYFLEEDATLSPNHSAMTAARECWANRDCAGVLRALEGYRAPDPIFDPERGLLEFLALLWLAEEALDRDRLPYAQSLLRRAEECQSPYLTDDSALQRLRAKAGLPARLNCDETLLLQAEAAMAAGETDRCRAYLAAVEEQSAKYHLLRGLCLYRARDYKAAAEHLQSAEAAFPDQTVARLEVCFRELGDFKKAYEYACKQRR